MKTKQKIIETVPDLAEDTRNSDERIEDLCFENLVRRWTEDRQWDWVTAANVMWGHILEERERSQLTGAPVQPEPEVIEAEIVD